MGDADYYEMEVPIDIVECRICQEDDFMIKMEAPCACLGTMKLTREVLRTDILYAHRACVQMWCDQRKNTTCEICGKPFSPGYIVTPPPQQPPPVGNQPAEHRISMTNISGDQDEAAREALLVQADDDPVGEHKNTVCETVMGSIGIVFLVVLAIHAYQVNTGTLSL